MGLDTIGFTVDVHSSYLSGSSCFMDPSAIHRTLQEEALYQGSGGVITSFLSVTPSGAHTQIQTATQNKLANAINDICLTFGLTKENLAQICDVHSRKTLYNWIDGKTKPRKSAMNRIYDLLIVARAWVHSGFAADPNLLYQPVIDEQSVFDLLSQPKINKELILFAGSRLYFRSAVKDSLPDPFA